MIEPAEEDEVLLMSVGWLLISRPRKSYQLPMSLPSKLISITMQRSIVSHDFLSWFEVEQDKAYNQNFIHHETQSNLTTMFMRLSLLLRLATEMHFQDEREKSGDKFERVFWYIDKTKVKGRTFLYAVSQFM